MHSVCDTHTQSHLSLNSCFHSKYTHTVWSWISVWLIIILCTTTIKNKYQFVIISEAIRFHYTSEVDEVKEWSDIAKAMPSTPIWLLYFSMRCVALPTKWFPIQFVLSMDQTQFSWFGTFSFLTKRMTEKVGVYASNYMHNNQFLVQAASHHS